MARRDTYNYSLMSGRRTVYKGITNDPEARHDEHLDDGKRFTHMVIEGPPKARSVARQREVEDLATYRRNHGGWNPQYNFRRDG
ncbi:MAG: GIY-YIG nuclease family protein [Pseudomonadota bacterium]|nr:GIY-YIG nuclease family protein [Pseudomonadota bacterium]